MVLFHSDKLAFYFLAVRLGEIGLIRAVRNRSTGWNGLEEGDMDGPEVVGPGLGATPFYLEVRQLMGSGGFHHFHWC